MTSELTNKVLNAISAQFEEGLPAVDAAVLFESITPILKPICGDNKRMKEALDYIMLLEQKRNPHLGRPRGGDRNCIFCMAHFALNPGSYGTEIPYGELAEAFRREYKIYPYNEKVT